MEPAPSTAASCCSQARPAIDWAAPDYLDQSAIEAELRRVFEVCNTCRRCEPLCDSFPRLSQLADSAGAGGVASLDGAAMKSVVDACTLCDICYPVCPYTPPHGEAIDFPNLMIRYRAAEYLRRDGGMVERELAKTDRNGRLIGAVAPLANWAARRSNRPCRAVAERFTGIHRDAEIPRFSPRPLSKVASDSPPPVDRTAPAFGRKVAIYGNCFAEYNEPALGLAARAVLAVNGIESEFVYPGCCGMPALERGDIAGVQKMATAVARELAGWLDEGYDVVSLIPSCSFMLKDTWPLYFPDDPVVARVAEGTFDICEYMVAVERADGLAPGMRPLEGGVALHIACHARAQNMGPKAASMLRLIPESDVLVMERCSGHGGTWGMMKENFETGMRVGSPVFEQAANSERRWLASECPLAGDQILQGIEALSGSRPAQARSYHPIQLLAMSYGVMPEGRSRETPDGRG